MQTVGGIVGRAKQVLQETGEGIRWKDSELIGWLNEAYIAVATMRPDAHSVTGSLTLERGARQSLPSDGLIVLDVLSGSDGRAPRPATRRMLSTMRPGWQNEKPGRRLEFYVLDPEQPQDYWLYPPAEKGSHAEVTYAVTPEQHDTGRLADVSGRPLSVSDRYATALLDFVLYRAFSKDAETQANFQRSQSHYKAFAGMMSGKTEGDAMTAQGGSNDAG